MSDKTSLQLLNESIQAQQNGEALMAELDSAKEIIRELLLVLHDHSSSKKAIADKARRFLGMKPGQRVGTREDKWEVMYPGYASRRRAVTNA